MPVTGMRGVTASTTALASSLVASPGSNAMIRLLTVKGSIALTAGRLEEARADLEGVIAASRNVYRTMRALLIRAELNLNVTRFDLLAREAELDYATAAGTLPFDVGT